MNKYERILNDTWEELENNYKGSKITFGIMKDIKKIHKELRKKRG